MVFKHPFTCLVSGPTGCGKTYFIKQLILAKLIHPPPVKIIFCYAQKQPLYHELSSLPYIKFIQGIPSDLDNDEQFIHPHLFIFDDLIDTCSKDPRITKLFTQGSHHRNLSIILITQNLFLKDIRTISLNSHYIVLFKSPRDQKQILYFASQMHPGDTEFIKAAYADATSKPHGYLILDFAPGTLEQYQVLTGVLPGERLIFINQKKNVTKTSSLPEKA